MFFGKKKTENVIEEDQLRTENACQTAVLLEKIVNDLKRQKLEADNLKVEVEAKRQKYEDMVSALKSADATLTMFLLALGEAPEEPDEAKEA